LRLALLFLFASGAFAHPPVSVVIDQQGNVYYSDLEQVWRVAPNGAKSIAVPNVHTHELYLDAQGNLFGEHLWYTGERTDKWFHYVWRRDVAGRITRVVPQREGFRTNYSFVRDAAGNMYWSDGGVIRKGNAIIARGLREPRWMHVASSGTLYVVDGRDVVRIRNGFVTRIVNVAAKPMGLWTDRAENVHVADFENRAIVRITNGRVTTVHRTSLPWSPTGGAFANNGELWVLEVSRTHQVRVRRIRLGS
jgi:sugar lactone lactonase YvrE